MARGCAQSFQGLTETAVDQDDFRIKTQALKGKCDKHFFQKCQAFNLHKAFIACIIGSLVFF